MGSSWKLKHWQSLLHSSFFPYPCTAFARRVYWGHREGTIWRHLAIYLENFLLQIPWYIPANLCLLFFHILVTSQLCVDILQKFGPTSSSLSWLLMYFSHIRIIVHFTNLAWELCRNQSQNHLKQLNKTLINNNKLHI